MSVGTTELGGIGVWTAVFDGHPMPEVIDAVQQLESLGIRTLWLPEAVGRDPFALAGILLSHTESLVVALGIANIYARDAMAMAAAQKTLSEAFPGRFVLGLGVSSPALVEGVRGHTFTPPLRTMRDYLAAMDSARYRAPEPEVDSVRVLAALGPKMLALAATSAAGAHPYLTTPAHTEIARQALGPGQLLAPEQMVVLSDDPNEARGIGRRAMSSYMRAPGYLANLRRLGFDDSDWEDPRHPSDRLVDAVVAWGDESAIAARVQAHHTAGADHVALQVLRADAGIPMEEWRRLAEALS